MGLGFIIATVVTLLVITIPAGLSGEAHCAKRKVYGEFNRYGQLRTTSPTLRCDAYYQWTVSEYCCYDRYDLTDSRPFCCHSETYKLLVAVGIICAMVLGASLFMFLCWCYNVPHFFFKVITCGKFSLNDYMKKTKMNGPYVDPSFYSGEPFWTSEGSEYSHYPLRPMPPRIFYPVPPKMDLRRWSNSRQYHGGQPPLFVLASRQFTRNPYSARPNERGSASSSISGPSGMPDGCVNSSRRSSTSSCAHYAHEAHRIHPPSFGFKVHIDEVDAASELLEALKYLDEKDKSFVIPKLREETETELDLETKPKVEPPKVLIVPTHTLTVSTVPTPPLLQLDITKLTAPPPTTLSQRTLSGTPFRRHVVRGTSIDSTPSSTSILESIIEERSSGRPFNQAQPSYSKALLPGYIPEEMEADLQDKARKSLSTA